MPREMQPTEAEIEDWKQNPVTQWWFGQMQDEFGRLAELKAVVDINNPGRTAMSAAFTEGMRQGFAWAVNFEAEREKQA